MQCTGYYYEHEYAVLVVILFHMNCSCYTVPKILNSMMELPLQLVHVWFYTILYFTAMITIFGHHRMLHVLSEATSTHVSRCH